MSDRADTASYECGQVVEKPWKKRQASMACSLWKFELQVHEVEQLQLSTLGHVISIADALAVI
jgi:hypothetical protein